MKRPRIIITTGDPNGIGREITKGSLEDSDIADLADFQIINASDNTGIDAVDKAVDLLMKHKSDALVTAPVNKHLVNQSGISFQGHTEYIAMRTNTDRFAMMFYSEDLKVTIVTRHIALSQVSRNLSVDKIQNAVSLTVKTLRQDFMLDHPRICVCSLNPHCGEESLMGNEEKDVIMPALQGLNLGKADITGPVSSDIAFHKAYRKEFDAVVSMYHDQGLGPFKMIAFNKGVNVTLGLPFVRTSPDHGTAYDIAGKGIADTGSMKEAIRLAAMMSSRRVGHIE